MLVDHTRGLGGALVKEEMSALVEGTQHRTGDLRGEDACVLERRDDVGGAVQHQRRHADAAQSLERVIRFVHRLQLR